MLLWVAAIGAVASTACDREAPATPSPAAAATSLSLAELSGRALEPEETGWLEVAWSGSWRELDAAGLWISDHEKGDFPRSNLPAPRVVVNGVSFREAPELLDGTEASPGTFALSDRSFLLRMEPDRGPPGDVIVSWYVSGGRLCRPAVDSLPPRRRVAVGPLASDGFSVAPGMSHEVNVIVAGPALLRFDTSCVGPPGSSPFPASARLQVSLGSRALLEADLPVALEVELLTHEVKLPDGAEGRLSFEVSGPPALVGIHAPRIAPEEATRGRASVQEPLPNILLFVSDTFRADSLSAYGGELGVTPELDRFAAQSLCFERAWSTSSWTLPAVGSLLLGVFPYQHGGTNSSQRPASRLPAIAEVLAAAGYRTAAVTDSAFVSRHYGIDRGFERFLEFHDTDLERTLRVAVDLLDRDDGRPWFLLVHTYQTHSPYEASDETRREHGERLGLHMDWEAVIGEVYREVERHVAPQDGSGNSEHVLLKLMVERRFDTVLRELAELRASEGAPMAELGQVYPLYLGGVADLDRAFGELLEALRERGLEDMTCVVFTSDHGEGFGEHGCYMHGYGPWEELLRVPLLIRGPGLEPGRVTHGASLVDLPSTLADLAGVPAPRGWMGRSLLDLERDRVLFAFDCVPGGSSSIAVLEGSLKLVLPATRNALEDGRILHAFDLSEDPDETRDLVDQRPGSFDELLERHARRCASLLQARHPVELAEAGPSHMRLIQALGYIDH